MERVAGCLSEFAIKGSTRRLSIAETALVGIEVFNLLSSLHSAVILHGYIHPGNVCQTLESRRKFKLIDFGRARFAAARDYSRDRYESVDGDSKHPYLSPWEILGYRSSYRDDAYRMLLTLSIILNERGLIDQLFAINGSQRCPK